MRDTGLPLSGDVFDAFGAQIDAHGQILNCDGTGTGVFRGDSGPIIGAQWLVEQLKANKQLPEKPQTPAESQPL